MIFCVTSTNSIGCTFLDWSIHYLSGQSEFYNTDLGWSKLSADPVQKKNAHSHPKNHPHGADETQIVINKFMSVEADLLSLNPALIRSATVAKKLNLDINKISEKNSNVYEQICNYQAKDYSNIFHVCITNNIPIIYLKQNSYIPYNLFFRSDIKHFEYKLAESQSEMKEEFLTIFFDQTNKKEWGDSIAKMPIWDLREFVALNIRPYFKPPLDDMVDRRNPHFYIDSMDWWCNGENKILEVFKYLKLNLDNKRYSHWVPIYRRWQKQQLNILNFCWNIDNICESIVNNYYLDIGAYNLDFWQEAILQHILIYKYKLNLKNWQLEKFPTNTQALHKLLEPNIHPTEILY
jgi:hypothetical protein